ncbi:MAG: phosphatase PAP2 family protein [Stellaceae bacterium]
MHSDIVTFTSLGNSVVTLPIAVAILVWLYLWLGRKVALAWLIALLVCGAVTAVLKIYFHACPVRVIDLVSPSGHTSLSFFVYGGLVLITGARWPVWPKLALWLVGAAFVLAIAISRLVLDDHSRIEVVIGLAVGGTALLLFWRVFRQMRWRAMPIWPIWVVALVPIVVLHTHNLPTESLLTRLALYLRGTVDFCA